MAMLVRLLSAVILTLLIFSCSNSESSGDTGSATGRSTISGTITTAATVNGRCFVVMVDTDSNRTNGSIAVATGTVTGTSFNYQVSSIDTGSYYLSGFVDLDSDCSGAANTGDHLGWAGSNSKNPPAGATVTVNAPTNYTYDFTLYVF